MRYGEGQLSGRISCSASMPGICGDDGKGLVEAIEDRTST